MPRGADAQPECIHYIFIFLQQRRIVRGSCVRSGFPCGGLTTLMSSNDLEGEHVSLGGDIRSLLLGPRDLCFESPADIFPQGVEKEGCNAGL
jgi:hypothetical protein